MKSSNLSELMQCHLAVEIFDYDTAIDWSIHLMANGIESENILILSSFSKPADPYEIRPYVTAALTDLQLPEFTGVSAKLNKARYHLNEIIGNRSKRKHLKELAALCVESEYKYGLDTFWLLHYGWEELDDIGVNYYTEGVTKTNIDQVVQNEANEWLGQFEEQSKSLLVT